ncbi:ATP-dependent DNA helicase RecG [Wolbachia endosymbiont of Pentidionis agamae]
MYKEQLDKLKLLNTDLENIPRFHVIALTKLCGSIKIKDLLFYKPSSYVDRSKSLLNAESGEIITFIAKVLEHNPPRKRGTPYKIIVENDKRYVNIIYFDYSVKYLYKLFPIGATLVISGRFERFAEHLQITHPDYVSANVNEFKEIACIEAVYRLSRGITNKNVKNIINSCVKRLHDLPEWIDSTLIERKKWLSWKESITKLHKPEALIEAEKSRKRLAYDELLAYQLALKFARKNKLQKRKQEFKILNKHRGQVLKALSFQLTDDQIKAIDEISEKQKSEYCMVSLLQGDVGSGKTIVALFAILNAVENNLQAALMVPTTILAEQHYSLIEEILSSTSIKVALLTSKTKRKEKKIIINELANGMINIVIGTHALFQDNILFKDLGLVVIDEQQRFGVMQRNNLIWKGENTDILFITATPIPRTLQQAIYGDIECLTLKDKPKCRLPIKTVTISMKRTANVIKNLKDAIDRGEKAYWICPYIKENQDIAAVEMRFQELQKTFTDKIGMVHSKLTEEQREQAMFSFKRNDLFLLVATTVIEVGVDVPDATIMIIESAEQFGLSQLHQLRGRVGRGNKPSFCILLYNILNKNSYLKFKIMRESQDGFYIAEKDMMIRGGGDTLGTKQSGHMEFKFADIYKDRELLNLACNNAKNIMNVIEDHPLKLLLNIFNYISKFLI